MENRALSMLGLIRKAGKLEAGFDASKAAARENRARLLLAARDVSEKTFKNLCYEGERAGIPTARLSASMEETGRACGIKAGVLAVTDRGFAKALLGKLDQKPQEKEEPSI